jgi:ferrous iron transport protein B
MTSTPLFQLDYGGKIEREIARMIAAFDELNFNTGFYSKRWLAIKLLEKDADILERVQGMDGGEKIIAVAKERAGHVESMLGEDFDLLTADRRYGYINGVVRQSLQRPLLDRITCISCSAW